MKIFYDTEFLENGSTIELIAIGMVAEDGRELYLVNEGIEDDPLYSGIGRHQWLMQNVIPGLPLRERDPITQSHAQYPGRFYLDHTSNTIMPRRMIRNAVREFIDRTPAPQLWAWYGAYDHVVLAQLFGRMVALPASVPMWTNDLQQEIQRLGVDDADLPQQTEGLHNALEDARHVARIAEYLAGLTDGAGACSCDNGWVEDQNWSPPDLREQQWDGRREPGAGLIRCGACDG